MREDLRSALRQLRRTPGVSCAVILTLALGVGANTAIFSLVNSLLLKPLPVRDPSRLVALVPADPAQPAYAGHVAYPVWREIRDRRLLDDGFAWATDRLALTGEGGFARTIWTTGNTFDVLGVPATLGRTLHAADDRRGGGPQGPVAVISHQFWRSRFGGAPDAIGRTLTIERVPFTIVGVTPAAFLGFDVGDTFDVILPLETEPLLARTPPRLDSPNWTWLQIMARRTPAQTPESLTLLLRGAQPQVRAATMPSFRHAEDRERYLAAAWTVRSAPGGVSRLRRQYGSALVILLGVVGVVLLVACANIATLLLGRAAARRFEFSVRRALGASRGRLVRLLLAESLLMSAIGALMGLAFAHWSSRLLVGQLSTWYSAPRLDLSLDWRVLSVTAAVTVTTAMLFGTAPALRALRASPVEALKRQTRAMDGTVLGAGGGLVIVQIALSLVLVVAAGLFLRSFAALAYRDLGFDRNRVLVAVIDARRSAVPAAGRAEMYERVRQAAAAVAGVESAATSMATPLGNAGVRFTPDIVVPGSASFDARQQRILTNPVSPAWFRTFGTRLLAGRDFDARDRAGAPQVAIVNEAFARRYFGGAAPVGRTLVEVAGATDRHPLEIVGLVEDAAFASVRDPVEPTIYRPLDQRLDEALAAAVPSISVSVRAASGGSPARLTASVAAAIGEVDRGLSISFQTVGEQLNAFYVRERLLALLSGFFGTLVVLLTAVGLYGVTSYAVSRRRTEIGIRMALGANPSTIVRLVLGRITLLTVAGIAAGAVASAWATRYIGAQLFSVSARDPFTFALASCVLAGVAGAAGWLPARRASRIDPAAVLRDS